MRSVVLLAGTPSFKNAYGLRRKVTPCLISNGSSFGIGFTESDGRGVVWDLLMPHPFLQMWRAMKILEQLKVIGNSSLCACYYVAGRELRLEDHQQYLMDTLATVNGGVAKMDELRARVLDMVPSKREWNRLISNAKKHNIEINPFDIDQDIKAGYLRKSSSVKGLFPTTTRYRRSMDNKKLKPPSEPKAPQVVARAILDIEVSVMAPKKQNFLNRILAAIRS